MSSTVIAYAKYIAATDTRGARYLVRIGNRKNQVNPIDYSASNPVIAAIAAEAQVPQSSVVFGGMDGFYIVTLSD